MGKYHLILHTGIDLYLNMFNNLLLIISSQTIPD